MAKLYEIPELTINWHLREECNYDCYFCYAKYGKPRSRFVGIYSNVLSELNDLKNSTIQLSNCKIHVNRVRINFAGGEPFLEKSIGDAINTAFEFNLSPSFITNGSLMNEQFIESYGASISVAGFSVDSFEKQTNKLIGREGSNGDQMSFERIQKLFLKFRQVSPKTILKINTVVCQENVNEDLTDGLCKLNPDRWKVLRVIPIHGAEGRAISNEDYKSFIKRHDNVPGKIVLEDNSDMYRSYLMMDPEGRFYQRNGSDYSKSEFVSEVGIRESLKSVEFDPSTYLSRY